MNKKVAYVRLDNRCYSNKVDKLYIKIRKILNKISIEEVLDGIIINIPSNSFSYISSIKKILIKYNIKYIIFEKELLNLENQISDFIDENQIVQFNGKILMKTQILEIIKYICLKRNEDIKLQNIYVFVNTYSKFNIDILKQLAYNCKSLNIVTEQIKKFKKIEEELYNNGILITVSNNKKKSARNAQYIVNLDFEKNQFEQYNINMLSIIINLTNEQCFFNRTFNGNLINNINIEIDNDYQNFINEFYGNIDIRYFLEKDIVLNHNSVQQLNNKQKGFEIVDLVGVRGVIRKFV